MKRPPGPAVCAVLSLAMIAGGCAPAPSDTAGETREPAAEAPGTHLPAPWKLEESEAGTALAYARNGELLATFFCPAASDELLLNVPAFRAVASEERMTLGAGETATALVADFRGDHRRGGVSATGPVPSELEWILAGPQIHINHGSQNAGPFPAPPAKLAARFTTACRDGA